MIRRADAATRWLARGLCAAACLAAVAPVLRAEDAATPNDGGVRLVAAEIPEKLEVKVLERGTSSRLTLLKAKRELPIERMHPKSRVLVEDVLNNISLYRRMPTVRCETDPRVFQFFTEHPDVAVSIWRVMGISQLQVQQTGPYAYESSTGDGTVGALNVLYRDANRQVVFCNGRFANPMLKEPIQAMAVIHLENSFERDSQGRTFAQHHADLFVSFPSQGVETVAKLISPLSNRIADRNFEEISLFVHMMSVAMSRQPGWIEHIARQLDGVAAGRDEELLELTARVHVDSIRTAQGDVPRSATLLTPGRDAVLK